MQDSNDDDELMDMILAMRKEEKPRSMPYMYCEVCSTELLLDERADFNVCPNCGLCYPYCEHFPPFIVVPYKRKWHLMTVIKKRDIKMRPPELEKILAAFTKFDSAYTALFPDRNMLHLDFIIKALAQKVGCELVAQNIHVKSVNKKTLTKWWGRYNLVTTKYEI